MADEPDYFEFLESLSDSISDILLFATQFQADAVILSYEQSEIAMRSLIAVGEEVRDKIEKEELKQVASKGVEDAKRTLVELNRHCLEIKSSGGFGFDDSMKGKVLGTGKEMLLAAVRVLKAADVFDCLRVIKKLRLALQTVDVFGNQVTRPSEFSELAGLVVGDCEAACKGMNAREKIVQDLEYREELATQANIVQKLSEPFVRIVNQDVNSGTPETQALRMRTLKQLTDALEKGVEIVELSSVDLFADIETSFQLMGSGSYDHQESPEAERASQQIEEVGKTLQKMEQVLKGDDLTPMVAEVKNVAKAIRAMEADVVAAGGMPKHKKLLATLAPLVQEVKSVLADPSPEQKQQVGEKIAQAAQANQELFDNLRGKLKKGRVEEVERVMKPSIYSNQYMSADPKQQILDPLQELKKEAAEFNDLTKDAKLYSNEQFRPDAMLGEIGKSNDALLRAAGGLGDTQDPSSAISVVVDPSLVNAQVFANQGMSADGSRLGDAMKDLLNAVDGLEPQDCRDIAQADQRIKNLIKEGKKDEVIPLMEKQLLACKSLSKKCSGQGAASLLEMANQLQHSLNSLKQGMSGPLEQYKKADVMGLLDDLTHNSKLSPLAKEAEWFKIVLEGEGKMDEQAKQTVELTTQIAGCLDVLLNSSDPQEMIQNGKNAAALSAHLSKSAKVYAQRTKRGNAKELQAVADNLRNIGTQLKILSCICASSGPDGNDPVKNCVASLQNTVKKSLGEIRVSCI